MRSVRVTLPLKIRVSMMIVSDLTGDKRGKLRMVT
jgi:hypothetical protein